MTVAIAILNWNGRSWLEKFLPTVLKFSGDAQVFVIDNASTDDSVSFLENNFPVVSIIKNDENLGFAGGYNEGLKKVDAELFCLLNSDVEVTENWLTPVISMFAAQPEVAAAQPKILDFNRRPYFEFAGAAGGLLDNLGYPYCRGRIFDSIEKDHGQYDENTDIFWASGCCFFIRSADFQHQGGFDARFFAHQEEIDLCWRLQNSGRKIKLVPESTIFHVGGGTLNKQSPEKTFLNIRNNLSMLVKNLPMSALWWVLPVRMVLDGFAAVYFWVKNGFPHFTAVLRAHGSWYAQLRGTWRRRGKTQITRYFASRWIILKLFEKN